VATQARLQTYVDCAAGKSAFVDESAFQQALYRVEVRHAGTGRAFMQ